LVREREAERLKRYTKSWRFTMVALSKNYIEKITTNNGTMKPKEMPELMNWRKSTTLMIKKVDLQNKRNF
jgi:hypothetical protein